MLTDANLTFSVGQTASTGDSAQTIDTKRKVVGNGNKPMWAVVCCVSGFGSDGKLTVEVQESDQKTGTYATIASSGQRSVKAGDKVAVPLPTKHKQFLKLKYTASGTAGKVDAYITESVETWEPLKSAGYWK